MHVVGYLVNTPDMGLVFGGKLRVPLGLKEPPKNFTEASGLWASSDSSWGRRPRPHGGHAIMRVNGPILWGASALKIVAMATAEAETAEASRCTKDMMYVKASLRGVNRPAMGPAIITVDNSAMHTLVTKENVSSRTRYFERATAFVRWACLKLLTTLLLVPSADCLADIFTKAVDKETFIRLRAVLLNTDMDGGVQGQLARARRAAKYLASILARYGDA